MFAVVDTVGGRPRQCTEAEFWRIVRSPRVAELCGRVERGEAALKRKLPAFCIRGRIPARDGTGKCFPGKCEMNQVQLLKGKKQVKNPKEW